MSTYTNYRKLYEKHHDVKLPSDWDVHHIDGDRSNNNIDNLIALSREDHIKVHLEQGDYGAANLLSRGQVDISGERNPMWGKTTSQKQKDAVSKAMKGKKKNYKVKCNWPIKSGKDNAASKAVICEGITYGSISEAGRAYGISKDSIRHRCLSDKPKWKDFSYFL